MLRSQLAARSFRPTDLTLPFGKQPRCKNAPNIDPTSYNDPTSNVGAKHLELSKNYPKSFYSVGCVEIFDLEEFNRHLKKTH